MVDRPSRCRRAVVTAAAGAQHLVVGNFPLGRPSLGVMARLAVVSRLNVNQRFATGVVSVVTNAALSRKVLMIDCVDLPRIRAVTVFTIVRRSDVRGAFSGCDFVVVAGHAGTGNGQVIKASLRDGPVLLNSFVAHVACFSRGDMVRRRARRNGVVMARSALGRRSVEDATDMATFTSDSGVATG